MTDTYAFVFGGRSTEHDASIHSIKAFLHEIAVNSCHKERLKGGLFIDRGGSLSWLTTDHLISETEYGIAGEKIDWPEFIREALTHDHFFFNLLHGNEGEDGCFQGISEVLGLKGSFGSVFAAAFTMSKWAQGYAVEPLSNGNTVMPETWIIDSETTLSELSTILALAIGPVVVKPNSLGASLFTHLMNANDADAVWAALQNVLKYDRQALVQRFISGEEYTCGCIQQNNSVTVLPIIRASSKSGFLGHDEKHSGGKVKVDYLSPDTPLAERIKKVSTELFKKMGISNMARFDYIYEPVSDLLYYLECNSIPGFGNGSAFPQMLKAAGMTRLELLDLCILNCQKHTIPSKRFSYDIRH